MGEKVCGVKEALKDGRLSRSRYGNYLLMYDELKKEEVLTMYYKLAPSILAADFGNLGAQVGMAQAGAEYIHLDVMDGALCPAFPWDAGHQEPAFLHGRCFDASI